jgi:tellurite resistance protein TerC
VVKRVLVHTYRGAKKVVVAMVGTTLILIGAAMIVLPGPALVVIPIGLGVLSLEFDFARRWLRAVRERTTAGLDRLRGTREEERAR